MCLLDHIDTEVAQVVRQPVRLGADRQGNEIIVSCQLPPGSDGVAGRPSEVATVVLDDDEHRSRHRSTPSSANTSTSAGAASGP